MENVGNNYLIIILIGAFLVFALIGYLIDMLRGVNEKKHMNVVNEDIPAIEITKLKVDDKKKEKEETEESETAEEKEDPDDLLNNYENDIE